MEKDIICTQCNNRCQLTVEEKDGDILVRGNRCPRGAACGREEFLGQRVLLRGVVKGPAGERIPVVTNAPVAKSMVYKATLALKRLHLQQLPQPGELLVQNICDSGADLLAAEDDTWSR